MEEVFLRENNKIENMIYEIRGKQVMLDSDLAKLYQVETKRINEAVKNNMDKFPERFSWKLTKEEYNILRSKFSTSSLNNIHGGRRYNPRVFTEQGIAMLATILKSKIATEVSIAIMDAFVVMRKYISNELLEQRYINNMVLEHDSEIKLLQESFSKFEEKRKNNEIYFNGQIYDAYSKIKDIISEAQNSLIIIDAYADKTLLDLIREVEVNVILIVKTNSLITKLDIQKYNSQYNNLKVIFNDTFHDRYFILDRKIVYHCGTSVNHAGSKTFSINILEDATVINNLIEVIDTITIKNYF